MPVGGPRKRRRVRNLAAERRQKLRWKDPGISWIQEEVGCRLQEGVPPCKHGMVQKKPHQENSDPGKSWIAEGSSRGKQRDDAPWKSVTAQRTRSQEIRPEQCSTENSERTNVQDETLENPECNNGMRDRGLKEQLRGNERINNSGIRRLLHRENIKLARQEGFRTGVRKASIRNFKQDTKNQRLDLVEWSTTCKQKKNIAQKGEAGNVEAPPPPLLREFTSLCRVSLGTSAHKEGAVAVVGEWSPQPEKKEQEETPSQREKKTLQAQPSEEKERWYTVRLFGTNSLKEGAMRRAAWKLEPAHPLGEASRGTFSW
jgi:hypothetical protein